MGELTERVLVLDFGGQYNQLIARRVRDHKVFAEILPYKTSLDQIKNNGYKGIIFTGGPNSVYDESSPHFTPEILELGIPILGICYGSQLMTYMGGGTVSHAPKREYGKITLNISKHNSKLFKDVPEQSTVWMSHTDYISKLPKDFEVTAFSHDCPCAAMENEAKNLYAVQFHPEVTHSEYGDLILKNFLFEICNCNGNWQMDDFIETTVSKIKNQVGDKQVILGLSGGVDSSVAAALLSRAVGDRLTCVFVDHGLMRKDEGDFVEKTFTSIFKTNFVRVNCKDRFLEKLTGITEPEQKRKIIGEEFYNVFWDKIREQKNKSFFAQGTIYPDRIESGKGDAAKIKTHHNLTEIPENIEFEGVIEPLGDLFKDEVRRVGEMLGIPKELVMRQPFPGPGLGVRIMGEITDEKIQVLQEADAVFCDVIDNSEIAGKLSQYFCVLPDVRTVGVMGDSRTYSHLIAIRAVTTDDFMTADYAKIPYDILSRVANRIVNEVEDVNRVVYDITSKPPGTVEWA